MSNCRHLHLQVWLLEQLLSQKNCYFRVLIALIFFCEIVVFRNSYCYEDLFKASNFCIFLFDLNEDFLKFTKIISCQFWFWKDCFTSFSCSFLCLQIIAKINKMKKRTQRDLHLTFNALSKHLNILL